MARYRFPWKVFVRLSLDLPSRQRSLVEDSREMLARMEPPPVVEGLEHIPCVGPVAIAANHYQRRGLWIGWPAAVVSVAVADRRGAPPSIHWLATGGLRLCQKVQRGVELPGTRLMLRHVAHTYDMAALPLSDPGARALALRTWLSWAREGHAIGVFPEGVAGRSHALRCPEPGFHKLCRLMARQHVPVVPAGIFEVGDTLHVRFGPRLNLTPSQGADDVMRAIAALVPPEQRGPYECLLNRAERVALG